jgi:mannose-6-phosphate isomerase-like protein (cupin superfamily)
MTVPAEPRTTLNITDIVSGPIPPRENNPTPPNSLHLRIADVVATAGPPPWAVRLIADERNTVTLIANGPGSGNRPHWHQDFDEWWFIIAGTLRWELTGGEVIEATKDEMVWVPRGTVHHIQNVGDDLSLRMAVSMPPAVHYFSDCEQCGYTDDGPRAFW